MTEISLIFIPLPVISHLTPTLEIAKTLLSRDPHLSITFLIIQTPNHDSSSVASLLISSTIISDRIRFLDVPNEDAQSPVASPIIKIIQSNKTAFMKTITDLIDSQHELGVRVAGLVLDMFCTDLIDIATDFNLPSYIYYTCGSSFLALLLHVQKLCDDQDLDVAEFKDSGLELCLPRFSNSVPARLLPSFAFLKKDGFSTAFVNKARQFRKTKGILVNSFVELESHSIESMRLDQSIPPVYSVGPVLDLNSKNELIKKEQEKEIMEWLDCHPPASVVFLCFGSRGAFQPAQVKEIALGLESSGCRFLWALRRPSSSGVMELPLPEDYEDFSEVLPKGFLERTALTGKVIGWAPQASVLGHSSIGGFVSHCGWNSILESLWFGVPIATWPLYAEQQINAYEAVKEMGIAVEISLDYRIEAGEVITSEQIERGVREVMEAGSEVRKKVKLMTEKSREAVVHGGSSYNYILQFLDDLRSNIGMVRDLGKSSISTFDDLKKTLPETNGVIESE